jgi:hypothetical protein
LLNFSDFTGTLVALLPAMNLMFSIRKEEVMRIRSRFGLLLILAILFIGTACFLPGAVGATGVGPSPAGYVTIDETFPYSNPLSYESHDVSFDVHTDLTNIVEFVVGFHCITGEGIDFYSSSPPPAGWSATQALRDVSSGNWSAFTEGTGEIPLGFLAGAPGFDDFNEAFIFTGYQQSDPLTHYATYYALNTFTGQDLDLYDGFYGDFGGKVSSPVAILFEDGSYVFGETGQRITVGVPEPSTLPLILSGMAGLLFLRRRSKK